jgi:hypothetical protein
MELECEVLKTNTESCPRQSTILVVLNLQVLLSESWLVGWLFISIAFLISLYLHFTAHEIPLCCLLVIISMDLQ